MKIRMGKVAALVCAITLGTLLLATADTGDGHSPVDADENANVTTGLTSINDSSTQRTTQEVGSKPEENSETNGDDNSGSRGPDGVIDGTRSEAESSDPVCGSPPEIDGAVIPRTQGTRHSVGSTVTYSCHFGYVSRNSINHISTCRINEESGGTEWTRPEITCIPRSCGDPGYLNNGRRIGNLFTFPNKVEYECDEGYNLRGLKTRYCQAGGDWSGRIPMCELIYCTVPPHPANGRVTYSSLEYGTELIYECNVGYLLKEQTPRFCSEDGSWSNEEPECKEARCEEPRAPEHGSVTLLSDLKVGSSATYSCNPGREMLGVATVKCEITGKWTFDAPQCLRSCSVPFLENGEYGRFRIRNTQWSSQEEFNRIYQGETVKPFETLFVRCTRGFLLMDDSKLIENGRIEVTCRDGSWSKIPQCRASKKASCNGAPPAIKNGFPSVSSREHGFTIWYTCNISPFTKEPGNVTCHYGQWIGVPPKCLRNPCLLDRLTYLGLVKPPGKYIDSDESFEVFCENGFRRAAWSTTIQCNSGRWNVAQNPCTKETVVGTISTTPMGNTSPESEAPQNENGGSTNPQNTNFQDNRKCSCTYDNSYTQVKAETGLKILKLGDKIPQGGTVNLECKLGRQIFEWPSGLRSYGTANMTCSACNRWVRGDLPTCRGATVDDVIIAFQEGLMITPGGVVDLTKGEHRLFHCISKNIQPQWSFRVQRNVIVTTGYNSRRDGTIDYITELDIRGAEDLHAGRYECYTQRYNRLISRTILDLRVNDITCPWFSLSSDLSVSYTAGNKVNSLATFRCHNNVKLVGSGLVGCQTNGKWSSSKPSCEDMNCPRFPDTPELIVRYSKDVSISSIATFHCSSSDRNLVGQSVSMCQENGTWSNSLPSCGATGIRCPAIDGGEDFSVYYNNERRINSTANFMCRGNNKRVDGCSLMICLPSGEWTRCNPTCVDFIPTSCPRFPVTPFLLVHYSRSTSIGSVATFSCSSSSKVLVGSSESSCLNNFTWSNPPASCEDPGCSLGDLVTPEDVEPDVTNMIGKFIPYGSEVKLRCRNNSIMSGSPKAVCKEPGRWDFGSYQCVNGCVLTMDPSSHLEAQPRKDNYRFGEFVLLSCPKGEKMSAPVERVMCMGDSWSDPLPDCQELKEGGQR